jgi:hypothetical protein
VLPKFIGDRIILNKMKEYLIRVVDMQLGRQGSDFEERLNKSKLDFRWEMLQKIEAAMEGMSAAIEKGSKQRSKGEQEVEARKQALAQTVERLDIISAKLAAIKETTGGMHG